MLGINLLKVISCLNQTSFLRGQISVDEFIYFPQKAIEVLFNMAKITQHLLQSVFAIYLF
jgi:hypothetical protein